MFYGLYDTNSGCLILELVKEEEQEMQIKDLSNTKYLSLEKVQVANFVSVLSSYLPPHRKLLHFYGFAWDTPCLRLF